MISFICLLNVSNRLSYAINTPTANQNGELYVKYIQYLLSSEEKIDNINFMEIYFIWNTTNYGLFFNEMNVELTKWNRSHSYNNWTHTKNIKLHAFVASFMKNKCVLFKHCLTYIYVYTLYWFSVLNSSKNTS